MINIIQNDDNHHPYYSAFRKFENRVRKMKEHNSNTILGLAILLSCVLTGCTQTEAFDPRTETPVVPVVQVQRGFGYSQSFTGIVGARIVSNLGFRVPGKITERLVDAGQTVKRGQAL